MYPLKIKEKYDQKNLSNLWHRFSVPYLWNYISWDTRENVGSHPAVDIVPVTPAQDIFSPLPWVVWKTWEDGAYGKFIVIEHKWVPDPDNLKKKTTLYSCYEHLSDVKVQTGQNLQEWELIGKTWNTGNSFGEHLHFQIDRIQAPFHPYWPYTWAEASAQWVSFSQWVNLGLGLDKAKMYTINPLVYLDLLDTLREGALVADASHTIKTPLEPSKDPSSSSNDISHQEVVETPTETNIPEKKEELLSVIEEKIDIIPPRPTPTSSPKETKEQLLEVVHKGDKKVSHDISWDIYSTISGNNLKKNFKDLNPSNPNYEYIESLVSLWYISWFWDDTFRPNSLITRAEFLKLLLLVSNTPLWNDETKKFRDIKVGWQNKYINTAIDLWIISSSNQDFRPNGNITKAEALKMILLRFIWESYISVSNQYELGDISWNEWFAKYVFYALDHGFLTASWGKVFPNKAITRIELIEILRKVQRG